MSLDSLGNALLIQLLLIFLSGWLSAAETAFAVLRDGKALREEDDNDGDWPRLKRLWSQGVTVAVALRLGLVLIWTAAVVQFGLYLSPRLVGLWGEDYRWAAALLSGWISAMMVLLLGDLVPRNLAQKAPEQTMRRTTMLVVIVSFLLRPFAVCLQVVSRWIALFLGMKEEGQEEEVTEEEIRKMVDMGGETGAIEEAEKEMIENIFEFNNRTAEDVMTPRTKVSCLWVEDTHDTVLETIRSTGLSRFPVYDQDRDDIIGVLSTREYLLELQAPQPRSLREIIREAFFVPETVQADTLFRTLQGLKTHMAIVVDEYGGMSGIVTMEDLLEEIVGNIYDEFDPQSTAEVEPLGDNLWRMAGTLPLAELEELLDIKLPEAEDYGTLGGLIFSGFDTIPQDGSQPEVEMFGLHIQVEEIADHRVVRALVSKAGQHGEPSPSSGDEDTGNKEG